MSRILEATAVVKAKDATGGVFESIAAKIRKLNQASSSLGRDLDRQIAMANKAAGVAARPWSQFDRHNANGALAGRVRGAVSAVTAYEGARATRALSSAAIKSAAQGAHERVRMETAGMAAPEMKEAEELSAGLSKKYRSLSQTSILHTARNVRSVVGTFEEAAKILDPLLRLRVIAEGAHPERAAELADDFDKIVKATEIKGVTQNPEKFVHYMDGMAKALNVYGDTLRPMDYYEMFKFGRASTTAMSDDYMLGVAPTLAQEMKGMSAGQANSSWYTQMVGGKMSNIALKTMAKYGMIDMDKVEKTKTGLIKGVLPGGVGGQEFLRPGQTDPYKHTQWMINKIREKEPDADNARILQIFAAISSKQTTAQMLGIYATQQARIEKDLALIRRALGLESADTFLKKDPYTGWSAVKAQFTNLLQAASDPLVGPAAAGMKMISEGLSSLTGWAKEHPTTAAAGLTATVAGAAAATVAAGGYAVRHLGQAWRGPATGEPAAATSRVGMLHPSTLSGGLRAGLTALGPALSMATQSDIMTRTRSGRLWPDALLGRAGLNEDARNLEPLTLQGIAARLNGGAPAELNGTASIEVKVTNEPSADFITRIQTMITNGINAVRVNAAPPTGTAGSTGSSMPEAGAPR